MANRLESQARHCSRTFAIGLLVLLVAFFMGCRKRDSRTVVTIWHQSRPAEYELLRDEIARFEAGHPDLHVRALYKETEELRSGFQTAALAGGGPELIFGPSDVPGTFQAMGVVKDMSPWFPEELRGDFVPGALTYLPATADPTKRALVQVADRFGNHLALVYNRRFIKQPPKTTDELIELALKNTVDENGDGRPDRYGLVWNFSEPFFGIPFLTGFGGWVFEDSMTAAKKSGQNYFSNSENSKQQSSFESDSRPVPALDTPQTVAACEFMQSLPLKHGVTPQHCDYELADLLFKTGRAAMIINGDWSWGDYLKTPGIDAAIAVLPVVSSTGLPMRTMFSPKGYSLNANTSPEMAEHAMSFVRYMVSDQVQRRVGKELRMLPARQSIQKDPMFASDPTLQASLTQLKNGRLMPTGTELRAVWDGMKPNYQGLLSGAMSPSAAASAMQRDSVRNIQVMNREFTPSRSATVIQVLGGVLLGAWLIWQRRNFVRLAQDLRRNPVAYLFALPADCNFCGHRFPVLL